MPRPARQWFRVYVNMIGNWKVRRLSPTERWLWVSILAAARESCIPGFLMVSERHALIDSELASYADVPSRTVKAALPKMVELGMISFDEGLGAWQVANWDESQFESDTSAERTEKYRHNKHDSDVTTPSHVTANSVSVSASVSTSKKSSAPTGFDEFYAVYPLKVARSTAEKAFVKALTRTNIKNIITGAARYRDDPNREKEFTKHPATWLNAGCWDDDPLPERRRSVNKSKDAGSLSVIRDLEEMFNEAR